MTRGRESAPRPPRLARALLRLYLLGARREEVDTDLAELFAARTVQEGPRLARRQFWRDVLSLWWHRPARHTRRHPRPSFEVRTMWNDVIFAMRLLRRERTLSLITLASMTLAVGLTTALYGVLNAVGQPESGIRDPERVFAIERSKEHGAFHGWNYQELATLQAARSIGVVAALNQSGALGQARNEPDAPRLPFTAVSGAYFDQLGGRSAVGRLIRPDDDQPGASPVVVLSHGLWQHGFSGDASVVGRTLWLGNTSVTVAGVVDRGFTGAGGRTVAPPAFWVALAPYGESAKMDRADQSDRIREQIRRLEGDHSAESVARRHEFDVALARLQGPWNANVDIFGRLAPTATQGRAESELTAAAAALLRAHGDEAGAARIDVNLNDLASASGGGDSRALTKIAVGILVLLLLVACVNVSNVLFAGAIRRRREIGTRPSVAGAGVTNPGSV